MAERTANTRALSDRCRLDEREVIQPGAGDAAGSGETVELLAAGCTPQPTDALSMSSDAKCQVSSPRAERAIRMPPLRSPRLAVWLQ